jgi:hypothetical protein
VAAAFGPLAALASPAILSRSAGLIISFCAIWMVSAFTRIVTMLAITTVQTWTLFLYHPDTRSIESLNQPSSFCSSWSTESVPFMRRACSDFFTSLSGRLLMDALICPICCSAGPAAA